MVDNGKTIEVELDEVHEKIYDELVDKFGEEAILNDIQSLVQQNLYQSKYNNDEQG